jgi:hypothetical protein
VVAGGRPSRKLLKYSLEPACDTVNRKDTIVIKHLIPASDIAHTMQYRALEHWKLKKTMAMAIIIIFHFCLLASQNPESDPFGVDPYSAPIYFLATSTSYYRITCR